MFNGDNPKAENDVEFWIEKFPKALNTPISQCVCFAHHLSGSARDKKPKTLKGASTMKIANTCIEEGSSTILPSFDSFMNSLMDSLIEKMQREEQNLMNE